MTDPITPEHIELIEGLTALAERYRLAWESARRGRRKARRLGKESGEYQRGNVVLQQKNVALAEQVQRVRDLHTPETPPDGSVWVSGGRQPHCEGCATGDPFLDQPWPCSTIRALDGGEGT